MKTFGFTHNQYGIRLKKTLFEGFPSAYVTHEVSNNGWTRIVGSYRDSYRNDFTKTKDAINYVKDLITKGKE